MAERAELIIDVEDKASKKLKTIGKTGEKSFKGLKVAAGIATAGIVAIGAAIGGTIALLSKFAKLTDIQEQAELQLANALRNTGQDAKAAMPHLKSFASSLQDITVYGDETILQMQTLLVSLGGLKGKGLEDATKATLDLSSALKIDLKAAALLMGKAAAGETSSLTRYGLIIEKGANKAATFANVLKGVNEKFGGAAQTQAATYSGRMQQISNAFGDLEETIGKAVTQNKAFANLSTELIIKLKSIGSGVQEWIKKNEVLLNQIGVQFAKIIKSSIDLIFNMTSKIVKLANVINKFGIALGLWADASDATAKKQKKLDQQIAESKGKIKQYTEAWRDALKAETEGTTVTTKHIGVLGGASTSLKEYNAIQIQSSQDLMKLIEAENAHINVLKEKQTAMIVERPTEKAPLEETLPGPTPDQIEQRNFALEAMELDHLGRRFALLQEDQSRELALLDLKHEEELLKLEEQLANETLSKEEHNIKLAEIADLKEIQDLERKTLFQKKKDAIEKKALKEKEKRLKKDAAFISGLAKIDMGAFKKAENKKLAVFNFTRQAMSSIAQGLFVAFGKKSRTLFEIAKGANIAQAIMNTYQGATKAFAQYGFPYGAVAAAAVIAQGMGQVATIRAQKMAEGGIVTGPTTILAGEAGPEKIIPLDRADEEGFGNTEQSLVINFTGPILGDEEQAKEFALAIDEELYNLKTQGQSLAFA